MISPKIIRIMTRLRAEYSIIFSSIYNLGIRNPGSGIGEDIEKRFYRFPIPDPQFSHLHILHLERTLRGCLFCRCRFFGFRLGPAAMLAVILPAATFQL